MSSNPQSQRVPSRAGFVVRPGEDRIGKPLSVVGDQIRIKVSSDDTNGAFAVVEDVTPPNGGPPLHRHYDQDEWWHVIEGDFLFEVDGTQTQAGPGAIIFAPKGSSHAFQNIGSSPGRTLVTVVPGGLDRFFEELDVTVLPGTAPNPEAIGALFQKHGMELLGPPLAHRHATDSH